jgi:hypothetical protein
MNSYDAVFNLYFKYLAEDDPDDADFEPATSGRGANKVVYLWLSIIIISSISFVYFVV